MPIFASTMISAKPANAATINVGTVLRVFVVHTGGEFYAEAVRFEAGSRTRHPVPA